MRVISGQKRGKKLKALVGDTVRPTTDKVKESIFNVIQFDIFGAKFLDLFAGSGQIGIEALSRGAQLATFVDKNKESINVVKRNLSSTGFEKNAKVINMDSILFLEKSSEIFDIAFLDPPYASELLNESIFLIPKTMSKNGIIICEHPVESFLPDKFVDFYLSKVYKYGKIAISVYRRKSLN